MSKYTVMLTDTVYPDATLEAEELKKVDAEIVRPKDTSVQSLIETGKNCDGILCDYVEITAEVIAGLNQCKAIAVAGIGVNNIDLKAAAEKGIKVANVPHYCLGEVADHAMALFLACAKKVTRFNKAVDAGRWDPLEFPPVYRLADQNFCIFGFGSIARKAAKRAQGFEMDVYAYDPYLPDEVFASHGVKRVGSLV
ncbi:C-terminal binding protein, partial [Ruminococcaceae bacterium OttesenSCG-928-I18]|nr:C-terminal binding protein [Ruminococcaceae bacterium OttesenSCG-928-I18]